MIRLSLIYGATLVTYLALDFIWLTMAAGLYRAEIGALMRPVPNIAVAGVFYALYAAGVVVFAVRPGDYGQGLVQSVGLGIMLGLVAYGTYDLTNWAAFQGYTAKIALIDLAWGSLLTGLCALAGRGVAMRLS
jgi:uncharacterized membrane protein